MNAPYNLTTSYANVNLDSAAATQTPKFIFSETQSTTSSITVFACKNPPLTCLLIKEWLLDTFSSDDLRAPGIVRMETLELHLLPRQNDGQAKQGWLLLCEDAAVLPHGEAELSLTVLAVLVPGHTKVRWFYALPSVAPLLHLLDHRHQIHLLTSLAPPSLHHARLYTYIRENFLRAVEMPESPDFLTAQSITDYCPNIIDPDTALKRLEGSEALHFGYIRPPDAWARDLSDDRYLLHLHEAEREVASIAGFKCAEYLVVKRNFFRAFWVEIYRSDKNIFRDSSDDEVAAASATTITSTSGAPSSTPRPQRVRSDNAHAVWLEKAYGMRKSRAHMVVVAWRVLGFLDEQRFKAWVKAGGMFENSSEDEDEDGEGMVREGEEGGEGCLANVPAPLAARRALL